MLRDAYFLLSVPGLLNVSNVMNIINVMATNQGS